jgi:hypothetical protein
MGWFMKKLRIRPEEDNTVHVCKSSPFKRDIDPEKRKQEMKQRALIASDLLYILAHANWAVPFHFIA